jgi:D-tagatose-1,6-bisphosphate aldolase subunit GatZ/KbaZ
MKAIDMSVLTEFTAGLERNRAGKGGVAASICSAHPLVLRALFRSAKKFDTFALVESTSNQVDQYGGYTGMRPGDFVRLVHDLAREEGFPAERVLLGGDHLGPNSWRARPAAAAMAETRTLVEAYVKAGYRKLHLDASFVCADDTAPLTDEVVAARCAEMAKVCEAAWEGAPPLYVVGTEVPTPGGVYDQEEMHVTTAADVEKTLSVFQETFRRNGLQSAWERVVGLVVQPGVEFGDGQVHDFQPVPDLASTILRQKGMVYEAHSTDYQTPANLRRLVEHHFFILKVGPWLTYALREGGFLLELIERELRPAMPSRWRDTLVAVMKEDPKYWAKYYSGTPDEVDFKLCFSYSDRARYYLGRRDVQASLDRLFANLADHIPESLLSQYLPAQYAAVREGSLANAPRDLVVDRIRDVIDPYLRAGAVG